MGNILLVALGGAVGSVSRHLVGSAALRAFGTGFPVGTLIVNVVGCLVMGLFVGILSATLQASPALRLLIATGFLGGFTTFSTFSLDVAQLWERGDQGLALFYGATSVILSIAALFAGLWIVRALT